MLKHTFNILPEFALKWHIGLDGESTILLFLTFICTASTIFLSKSPPKNKGLFYNCIILISLGATGTFLSKDLFFFYIFHEIALIPSFIMLVVFGGPKKKRAVFFLATYLFLASLLILLGFILLANKISYPEFNVSFEALALNASALNVSSQKSIFIILFLGFAILIAFFPFHSWVLPVYTTAPTPVSILHLAVLKKIGVYALFAIVFRLLPEGFQAWKNIILWIYIFHLVYISYLCLSQKKLDRIIILSSVLHIAIPILGFMSFHKIGIKGSFLMMFAHGILVTILFFLLSIIKEKWSSLNILELKSKGTKATTLGLFFLLASLASSGLPGFANFTSEFAIFIGYFTSLNANPDFFSLPYACGILSVLAIFVTAVYMLNSYRTVFTALPEKVENDEKRIIPLSKTITIVILFLLLIYLGIFPKTLLSLI